MKKKEKHQHDYKRNLRRLIINSKIITFVSKTKRNTFSCFFISRTCFSKLGLYYLMLKKSDYIADFKQLEFYSPS